MRILKSVSLALAIMLSAVYCRSVAAQGPTTWQTQSESAGLLAIDLITVTEPGVRHKCRVHSITEDSVVCGVGAFRKPVVYKRENVAALILPPDHSAVVDSVLEVAVGAGLIAGSFFVPITAVAVIMQVAGGLSVPTIITNLIFDNEDHDHDIVEYQRPNTPLTVTLR